jgi:hypothetical protein
MTDRASIEERRQRLSTRIWNYNAKGALLMEVETGGDLEVRPVSFDEDEILDADEDKMMAVDDAGDDSDVELEQEGVDDEDEVAEDPERMQLMMPSSFSRGDIIRLGLESLARQELEL